MGLMDSLKKATGIGLAVAEHYDRAYEKGVLLGPTKYAEAVGLFDRAAAKAAEGGDTYLQARALANARLYGFILSGNLAELQKLRGVLPQLQEVERIGSRTEMMPVEPLVAEIDARLAEAGIAQLPPTDGERLASAHLQTAEAFKRFFNAPLLTYLLMPTI